MGFDLCSRPSRPWRRQLHVRQRPVSTVSLLVAAVTAVSGISGSLRPLQLLRRLFSEDGNRLEPLGSPISGRGYLRASNRLAAATGTKSAVSWVVRRQKKSAGTTDRGEIRLFDYVVGKHEQVVRNDDAKRLGRFKIDD